MENETVLDDKKSVGTECQNLDIIKYPEEWDNQDGEIWYHYWDEESKSFRHRQLRKYFRL